MLSYSKKELRFIITLGTGKFGSSSNDQIILQGFRATADIDKAGGMMMGTLRAKIYGVKQDDMNSITTLQWKPGSLIPNTVEVYAVEPDAETLVFAGNIVNAWGDYQGMPDVFLHIQAQAAYFNGLRAVKPFSIKGGVDAAVVMERIATDMGLAFENNNVSVMLTDVYLANTLKEQALELARMCNFTLYIDDKVLAITNKYSPRKGLIPEISAQSGLIGYPTFDGIGVNFQTVFNPAVAFGGAVKLTTDIERAAGEWVVVSVSHRLESEKPGGAWFSTIRGNLNGLAVVKQ
jgi:hypothetical protein